MLGLRGVPDQTAYCAAKHGVVGFTRALALALAPRGITVNALCPGWVDTEWRTSAMPNSASPRSRRLPACRPDRVATPAEVADAVVWLAAAGGAQHHRPCPADRGRRAGASVTQRSQSNNELTELSSLMRRIASASSGAMVSSRMLSHCLTSSVA